MKKILLIVAGLVLLVVIGLVVFVFTGLGAAIEAVVENVGSQATGTEVTLRKADVSVTSGEGLLAGLVVGNPKGYGTPSAFELGKVQVKIDTSTVTSDTIVIREIVIEGPHVTYEVGPGGSNVAVIQQNVAAFGGGSGGKGGGGKGGAGREPAPKEKDSGTKLIIENLYIRGGRIDVSASFLKGQALGAALPDVHLRDIGKDKGGATPGEVASKVLDSLTSGTLGAVSGLGLDKLKDAALDKAGGLLKGVLGK